MIRSAVVLSIVIAACGKVPPPQGQQSPPQPTAVTLAINAWAVAVDADTARLPRRCIVSPELGVRNNAVLVYRPDDSSTKLVADYAGGGLAVESFFALRDTVRLFVRVDSNVVRQLRNEDSLWFGNAAVIRWVDSTGKARMLEPRAVGFRAFNIQRAYDDWRRAIANCL